MLTWREPRKVTKSLTVQYDRVMYLLDDTPENRKLIDRVIEVWEYPDGRIELRADGRVLPTGNTTDWPRSIKPQSSNTSA